MSEFSLSAIVCVNSKGFIGKDGDLLYRIKEDLDHFKRITMGNSVVSGRQQYEGSALIMGRKTYESIGRPLPYRHTIVVTSTPISSASTSSVTSIEEAIDEAKRLGYRQAFLCGGESIYKEGLKYCEGAYVTTVMLDDRGDASFDVDAYNRKFPVREEIQSGEVPEGEFFIEKWTKAVDLDLVSEGMVHHDGYTVLTHLICSIQEVIGKNMITLSLMNGKSINFKFKGPNQVIAAADQIRTAMQESWVNTGLRNEPGMIKMEVSSED